MADKIILEIDTGNSVQSLGKLENELAKLREDIKEVEIGSAAFKKMATQIQNTESTIKTLNKQMEGLEPQQKAEAFLKMGEGIAGSFAIASGAMAIFGSESERLQELQTRVQGAIAIAMGARMLSEAALQAVTAKRIITEKASTIAGYATAAANKIATLSFKAMGIGVNAGSKALHGFKAALISTGVGALIVLIGSAIGALVSFASSNKEFGFSQDEVNEAVEEANTEFDKMIERLQLAESGADGLAMRTHDLSVQMKEAIGDAKSLNAQIAELTNKQQQLIIESERLANKGLIGRPRQAANARNEAAALQEKIDQLNGAYERQLETVNQSVEAHNNAKIAQDKERQAIANANKERERQLKLKEEFLDFARMERPLLLRNTENLKAETEILEIQRKLRGGEATEAEKAHLENLLKTSTAQRELNELTAERRSIDKELELASEKGLEIQERFNSGLAISADESVKLERLENAQNKAAAHNLAIEEKRAEMYETRQEQKASDLLVEQERVATLNELNLLIGEVGASEDQQFINQMLRLEEEKRLAIEAIEDTEKNKEQLLRIEELYSDKLRQIQKERDQATQAAQVQSMQDNIATAQAVMGSMGSILGSMGSMAGESERAKQNFALASIMVNTASGIAGAISAGAGLVFPANLAAIMSGVAAVVGGMVSARQAMQGSDQFIDAGLQDVPGTGGGGGGGSAPSVTFTAPTMPTIEELTADAQDQTAPAITTAPATKAFVVATDVISGTALQEELELQSTL